MHPTLPVNKLNKTQSRFWKEFSANKNVWFLRPLLSISFFLRSLHELGDNTSYFANKIMEREQAAEKEKQVDINLWSKLHGNLLGEILSRLCLTDHYHVILVLIIHLHLWPGGLNSNSMTLHLRTLLRSTVYRWLN